MKKYLVLALTLFIVYGCGSSGSSLDDNKTNPSTDKNDTFSVKLSTAQNSYTTEDNVTIKTVITGETTFPTYAWIKDGVSLADTTSELNVTDFNASKHTVTVIVSSDGVDKNDTIVINVSNYNDFDTRVLSTRKDEVLVQKSKNLMWVSDENETKKACLAVKNDGNYTIAQTFCEDLTFAGNSDWRKPTVTELVDFIKDTGAANILPAYYAPCKLLIGTDSTNSLADTNGNVAVVTRYGVNANFGTLGDIQKVRYNIGLRCVRSSTQNPPTAVAGEDMINVDFNSTITFDAGSSTDDGTIVKYEWIYGGHVLNSDTTIPTYTRLATSSGDHNVTLRVTDNDGLTDEDYINVNVKEQ
jgi:hypothetical protein